MSCSSNPISAENNPTADKQVPSHRPKENQWGGQPHDDFLYGFDFDGSRKPESQRGEQVGYESVGCLDSIPWFVVSSLDLVGGSMLSSTPSPG